MILDRSHPRAWLFRASWALLAGAAISFSAGGKILYVITRTDRILDESVGLALALLLCLLGAVARYLGGEREEASKEPLSGTQE